MRHLPHTLGLLIALSSLAAVAVADDNLTPPADLDDTTRALFNEAKAAFNEAESATSGSIPKMERAIDLLHQVRKRKRFALPYYYLGILYQWTQEYDEARIALKEAVKLKPEFYQAWVEYADVHVWLKRYQDSLPLYQQAAELSPDYHKAYEHRAFVLVRMGRFDEALEDLARAREAAPDEATVKELAEFNRRVRRALDGPPFETTYTRETKSYLVRTPVSQEFADFIGEQAELIHKLYSSIFPSIRREKRKYVIVVYRDKAEYQQNGGPKGAGGHYDPLFRQLELFRYSQQSDTLLVLYHEGFHQFLHDYLERAPQWFNEGVADYFGPSQHVGSGMRIRVNPWRLRTIQKALRRGTLPSLYELLHMTQAEMYNPAMAGIHYAQAWSFIYFLCEYQNRKYFPLLKEYFRALRKGKGKAEAYKASFGKVAMADLEQEWRRYILKLRG